MKKKRSKIVVAALLGISMMGTTVYAGKPGIAYNATTWYQHGSSVQVSENQLKATIPAGYDVNESTQASAKKGLYQKLFTEDKVEVVNITVDENNWNYLLQHANKEPYVLADSFTIGGESVDYVGLKTKGNYTLLTAWQSDTDRFSFAVNVGKYIKKSEGYSDTQNFYGMKKFSLNNVTGDSTYLKEYLSYKLFREMGIPAPQCSLVKLCINGKYWGVYSLIENIDSPLYKSSTSFSDVDFYKCDKTGGSLIYNSSFDRYLDGSADFDLSTYDQQGNVLAGYIGLWDHQETGTSIEDYQDDMAKATTWEERENVESTTGAEVKENIKEVMTWMKKLNELNQTTNANTASYEEAVAEILDVDAVLKYFAANTFLVSMDSYQSDEAHNYCLGFHDGKAFVVPWDYNYSFGAFDIGSASEFINFNIDNPVVKVSLNDRPLLNVLLKNENFRAKYEQYLLDCCEIASAGGTVTGTDLKGKSYTKTYEPNYFGSIISNFKNGELGSALRETPAEQPFYSYDQYANSCQPFQSIIAQRALAVQNQVADNFNRVPDLGISMSTFGFSGGGMGGGGWNWPGGWFWPWPQNTPTPAPTVKPTEVPTVKPTIQPVDSSVKVQLSNQTDANSNTIGGSISLTSTKDAPLDLSKLKVSYFYTKDNGNTQNVWIDSASIQYQRAPWYTAVTDNTSAVIRSFTSTSNKADCCMDVSFSSKESLDKNATLTISFRIANNDWSNFNQENDYSYEDSNHIVVTYDGTIINGAMPN